MCVCIVRLYAPPGINQPRKTCRKVLMWSLGAAFSERGLSTRPYRVPETPRGPRGDFLVLCLILPDADDPTARLQFCRYTMPVGVGRRERRIGVTGSRVGSYRRSRMTRQANCVISVQRTPPLLLPQAVALSVCIQHITRLFVFQMVHLLHLL